MERYKTVLSIAGSDSSAGAGIQADIKTIAALQCYGCSVITAVTAQNTQGVKSIHHIPAIEIKNQLEAIVEDIEIDAVKIGMIGNSENIQVIIDFLKSNKFPFVILDPVMVATSGDSLFDMEALSLLKNELIPLCNLITPNIAEAEVLLGGETISKDTMRDYVVKLGLDYNVPFLLKGAHLKGKDSKDYLFLDIDKEIHQLAAPTIDSNNTHGTGCSLSSAIAANVAKGYDLERAVLKAKGYITQSIGAGKYYNLGKGHGPVHHFWEFWD